jgi:hypothetical protein
MESRYRDMEPDDLLDEFLEMHDLLDLEETTLHRELKRRGVRRRDFKRSPKKIGSMMARKRVEAMDLEQLRSFMRGLSQVRLEMRGTPRLRTMMQTA